MGRAGVWDVEESSSSAGREGCRWEQVMWVLEGQLVPTFLSWPGEPAQCSQKLCGEQDKGKHSLILPSLDLWFLFFAKLTAGIFPPTPGQGCTSWAKAALSFHHVHLKSFFLSELGFVTLQYPLVKKNQFCKERGTAPSFKLALPLIFSLIPLPHPSSSLYLPRSSASAHLQHPCGCIDAPANLHCLLSVSSTLAGTSLLIVLVSSSSV